LIGGPWLGFAMTVAATITSVSILNSTVLASTRMPFAMAEDGYLSPVLTKLHARFATPWVSIIVSAVMYAILARHTLTQLISVYIWLRIATSVLTVLSAWQLRRTAPDLPRAYRIPWGQTGLTYAVVAPLLMSGVALLGSDRFGMRWGLITLLLGPLAYLLLRRRKSPTIDNPSASS
jgi:amino acid transporter